MGTKKPLEVYNPSCQRSLMGITSFQPPYRNSTKIELGCRSQKDNKHYKSIYNNEIGNKWGSQVHSSNPAIEAYRNKWLRSRIAQ